MTNQPDGLPDAETPAKDGPMEIVFAPGCFDNFEGSPEELAELLVKIKEAFANGVPDDLQPLSAEDEAAVYEQLRNTATRQ